MRRGLRGRRGLAEIVGTLMLVLIVVAAAIAFSLFVAQEEKATLSERAYNDAKKLEAIKIVSLSVSTQVISGTPQTVLRADVASLDVNKMTIAGLVVDGSPVSGFYLAGSPNFQCFFGVADYANCTPLVLPSFSQTTLVIPLLQPGNGTPPVNIYANVSRTIQVNVFTTFGNEFIESFVPPVAESSVSFVGNSPILDGANSYQPVGGAGVVNASINAWSWTIQEEDHGFHSTGDARISHYGQSVQLAPFTPGANYWINLTVTNTFGLTGTTDEFYTAPGTLTNYSVVFVEDALPSGDDFSVTLGGEVEHVLTASGNNSITFVGVANGIYVYSIAPVPGYTASGLPTSPLVVSGTGATVDVTFS